jgi:hypothetical protein
MAEQRLEAVKQEPESVYRSSRWCGSAGVQWNNTRIPEIGCFGLRPGRSLSGDIGGHRVVAAVGSNGIENCQYDNVAVACNGCIAVDHGRCTTELGTVAHNSDKSVYFDVAQRSGDWYATNRAELNSGQSHYPGFAPTPKYMRIEREVYLSPNRADVFKITRASHGDFIAAGTMLQEEGKTSLEGDVYRPWAIRFSSDGTIKWQFVDDQTSGVKSIISMIQSFSSVVEFDNGRTILCGMTLYGDGYREFILDELGPDGKLLKRRTLLPSTGKEGFIPALRGCARSNNDVVIAGDLSYRRETGWIARLNENLDVLWEKLGDEYDGSIMAADAGRFFILSNRRNFQRDAVITEFGLSGETIARYDLPKCPSWIFVRPYSAQVKLQLVGEVESMPLEHCDSHPTENEIWSFDNRLRNPLHVSYTGAGFAGTALALGDGSIAIFGSSSNGHVIPSWIQMALVHPGSDRQLFFVIPESDIEYETAVQTDNPHEFVGVPRPGGGPNPYGRDRPVLHWVSFGE